ncbi:mucin-5AC [Drosophila busckii]|uniref:mucin-5AC n=1 Tax=Drosophila busckii TaxID=30019 RepID=UPI00083F2B02|nr:mucin-5AC [Drosophila busckii]
MIACLLLWGTTTSQARSVAKRETTNGRLDLDAFTADPDIVTLSSESVNGTTSPQPEEFTKLQTNNEGTTAKQMQVNEETSESPSVTTQLELQLEHKSSTESVQEKVKPNISTEAVAATATTQLPKLMPSTTDVPATSSSSTRAEDSARAMHFATSTERGYAFVPITPMKLRPLPMTSTTSTETPATSEVAPQLLAALLHAAVTVTPSTTAASQENIIELGQLQPLDEKRTKYISDNATNEQQLSLPNVAEVWSLAAMKMVPTTTTSSTTTTTTSSTEAGNDIEPQLQQNQTQQHKEKNLLDWQQIMLMQTGHENQTELALSTTLDATEAATQATTLQLAPSTTTTTAATTTTTAAAIESVTAASTTELTVTVQPLLTARTAAANVTAAPEPLLTEQTASVTAATAVKLQLTEQAQETTEPTITATATAVSETELATTTTTKPSALNATPNIHEMAMKATTQESNENSDKANDVDGDDVMNVSVSVADTAKPTTAQPIAVSTRTAGEVSTTTATTQTTPTPTPTSSSSSTLHVKVDEQLATTIATIIIATTTTEKAIEATPTPTEIVQISNEVNLETITVRSATNDNINKSNENKQSEQAQASVVNNLLITEHTNNSAANSAEINNNIIATTPATTATTTTTTTTSDLITLKDKLLNEQESTLEGNNLSETTTSTTPATTTTAAATTEATVAAATAVIGNALDESSTAKTTTTTTQATTAASVTETNDENDDELKDNEDSKQMVTTDEQLLAKVNMDSTTTTAATTTTTSSTSTTTTTPATTTTAATSSSSSSSTTLPTTTTKAATTTKTTTTTTEPEPIYSSSESSNTTMLPTTTPTTTTTTLATTLATTTSSIPIMINAHETPTYILDNNQMPHGARTGGTDVNVIIAITVSVIGVVALVLLVAFLYLMRKRQKQMSYGQRCRPVSLDAYSLDNVSVLGSVRRKGRDLRASKRTYGNAAFDDPALRHNLLTASELCKFIGQRSSIFEEFRDVPQIIARADEVPAGCEDKNRYANVIPLPETRVVLQRQGDDDKTEYINANYVRGPKDAPNYYIACQAPLESTVGDFWRMIWEQQSRVIIQATDLNENGIERCAEYLPPSVTLDNHSSYGDYQVTLKHREVKDKYAISTLMLKRADGDECRELTHYWYKWPEAGVPLEEAPIIAMLLEARSSLKSYALEQANELKEKSSTLTLKSLEAPANGQTTKPAEEVSTSSAASNEINGNVANKSARSQQGPLTIHCSPGTGRTGTIIACDMAIRNLETPKRSVDIPQLVYFVRRGRASAVQTKEQYEFIYKVANMYATKITNLSNDN